MTAFDSENPSKSQLREQARQAVNTIFDRGLFGASDIAPAGTLRGVEVLDRGVIFQKLARSHIISWGKYQRRIDILKPRTFFEKINITKFFAPVPMPSPADKLAVGHTIPPGLEDRIKAVPVYWKTPVAMSPEQLLDANLPKGTYFAKSNCSAQNNLRITLPFGDAAAAEKLAALMPQWLERGHGIRAGEWWYRLIRPQVFIEKDLSIDDQPPMDWKFHCANGRMVVCQIDIGRGRNHFQEIYDRDFNYLPHALFFKTSRTLAKPANYGFMVEAAEAISKPYEYARIDFYNHHGQLYLGEVTLAPFGGQRMPLSPELDRYIGNSWQSGSLF